jgi:hypothetical protein
MLISTEEIRNRIAKFPKNQVFTVADLNPKDAEEGKAIGIRLFSLLNQKKDRLIKRVGFGQYIRIGGDESGSPVREIVEPKGLITQIKEKILTFDVDRIFGSSDFDPKDKKEAQMISTHLSHISQASPDKSANLIKRVGFGKYMRSEGEEPKFIKQRVKRPYKKKEGFTRIPDSPVFKGIPTPRYELEHRAKQQELRGREIDKIVIDDPLDEESLEDVISKSDTERPEKKERKKRETQRVKGEACTAREITNDLIDKDEDQEERVIIDKLNKHSLLQLLTSNEVTFRVTPMINNVQKNYKGEIISFNIIGVSVNVDDREQEETLFKKKLKTNLKDTEEI